MGGGVRLDVNMDGCQVPCHDREASYLGLLTRAGRKEYRVLVNGVSDCRSVGEILVVPNIVLSKGEHSTHTF